MEKTTMNVQELAAQMGISLPKAYKLVKQPDFPVIHVGSRILIPVEAYKEWLREGTARNARSHEQSTKRQSDRGGCRSFPGVFPDVDLNCYGRSLSFYKKEGEYAQQESAA